MCYTKKKRIAIESQMLGCSFLNNVRFRLFFIFRNIIGVIYKFRVIADVKVIYQITIVIL